MRAFFPHQVVPFSTQIDDGVNSQLFSSSIMLREAHAAILGAKSLNDLPFQEEAKASFP